MESKSGVDSESSPCERLERELASVLAGELDDELSAHLAACDHCRDLRFDAEQLVDGVRDAGGDYEHPDEFAARVMAAASGEDGAMGLVVDSSKVPTAEQSVAEQPSIPQSRALVLTKPDRSGVDSRRRRRVAWIAGFAAAASLVWMLSPTVDPAESGSKIAAVAAGEGWHGSVEQVVRGFASSDGLQVCSEGWQDCGTLEAGAAFGEGSWLRTDGLTRAQLRLNDGSLVALDRATELKLVPNVERRAELVRGDIVAEIKKRGDEVAWLDVPRGRVEVIGTKLALHADERTSRVDVSRGEVRLIDEQERNVAVYAGQGGRLYVGKPPHSEALMSLSESFSWQDEAFARDREPDEQPRGLGQLRAKKPGEEHERKDAVILTRHSVKVRIVESMARTEVEEVFTNHTDEQLEGVFRFPLPPDAQIERLALEVDGKLAEGAFVDRERAAAIWRGAIVNSTPKPKPIREEIVWVPGPWKDPALLQWEGGGRFELRIFPIPGRSSRRIVLAYTQKLQPAGDLVRYSYPLAHDPSGSTRVGDFSADIQIQGHDGAVLTRGYNFDRQASAGSAARDERERLSFHERDFVPTGDLGVEFRLPEGHRELRVWGYQPDDATEDPYVALALQPRLPVQHEHAERAYVLIVDRSRSMFGEQYRRAVQVATRIVREMDRNDRVAILDCDSTCDAFAGDLREPGEALAVDVERYLTKVTPEGASDLVAAVRQASLWKDRAFDRQFEVVYVGDGMPTVGEVGPALVGKAVRTSLPRGVSVSALTVANDSDLSALREVTDASGGVVVRYAPGQSVGEAALALLGATYGHGLRDVELTLPEGFTQVAPQRLGSIAAGEEVVVTARMTGATLSGEAVLRGTLAGEPFEARYDVRAVAEPGPSNAFVPRLHAAAQITELERSPSDRARQDIVKLSGRFNVASRYTSLLVLESPAMFKAFGLDNQRRAPLWTGEVATSGSTGSAAGAALALADQDGEWSDDTYAGADLGLGGPGGLGSGFSEKPMAKSGLSRTSPSSAPKQRSTARLERDEAAAESKPMPSRHWAPAPRRRMIPMRRVWSRQAQIESPPRSLAGATSDALRELERRFENDSLHRGTLQDLYSAYVRAGDIERASVMAERWSEKDPLDPAALTARADVAAQRGQRQLAIRILGSVIDVRPSEYKAHWRLARLERWAGRPQQGCRHSVSAFEFQPTDAKLLVESVRCARDTGQSQLAEDLMQASNDKTRAAARVDLQREVSDSGELSGDFRVEATWDGAATDLDLVIVHPDGYRVSWLGAPTRSVITARDVLSMNREGLALRGAKPGEYAIEVVRTDGGSELIRGEVQLKIAGKARSIPFSLEGERVRIASAKIWMQSELVPLR